MRRSMVLVAVGCAAACSSEATSGGAIECGNAVVEAGEACDDGDTADGDGCDSTCAIETGFACSGAPSTCATDCGDGVIAGGELCDEGTANSDTLADACRTDCTPAGCGDGVADTMEDCDGADLGGSDCTAFGYAGAAGLGCDLGCNFVTTSCTAVCPNSVREPGEACDGANLAMMDCTDFGYVEPAGLACDGACLHDDGGCTAACPNGVQEPGEQCDNGVMGNSDVTPDACRTNCQNPGCGDAVVDTGEQCDGANLNMMDCVDLGHDFGTPGCDAISCMFDASPCGDCPMGESYCPIVMGCFNLDSDQDHCGICGMPCNNAQVCIQGMCRDVANPWSAVGTLPLDGGDGAYSHALATDGTNLLLPFQADTMTPSLRALEWTGGPNWSVLATLGSGATVSAGQAPLAAQYLPGLGRWTVAFGARVGAGFEEVHLHDYDRVSWGPQVPPLDTTCSALDSIALAFDGAVPHVVTAGAGGCGLGVEYHWYEGSWMFNVGAIMMSGSLITMDGWGRPSVVVTDQPYVGMMEEPGGGNASHTVRFYDTNLGMWTNLGMPVDVNMDNSGGNRENTSLAAAPNGDLYFGWMERTMGMPDTLDVYVAHWATPGGPWVLLGGGPINTADADEPSVAVIGGAPWVAMAEGAGVTVYRYHANSMQWVQVGPLMDDDGSNPGASPVLVGVGSRPFVAYREAMPFGPGGLYARTFP